MPWQLALGVMCFLREHQDRGLSSQHLKGWVRQHLPEILGQGRWHQEDLGGILDCQSSLKSKLQVQGKTLAHKIRWKEIGDTQHRPLVSPCAHTYVRAHIHIIQNYLCTKIEKNMFSDYCVYY